MNRSPARANILIVGNDVENRDQCRQLLGSENIRIREAADRSQAESLISKSKPELVIVNGMMMNVDGLECIRVLRSDPATRDIPVLALTLTEEDIAAALRAGADDYVIKPLQPREFVLRVRSLAHVHYEKAQLIQSKDLLGEHARIMGILLEFSHRCTSAKGLDGALKETITTTGQLLCCRRVSILLPEPNEKILKIAHSVGIEEDLAARACFPVGETTAGRVFDSGNAYIAACLEGHCRNAFDHSFFGAMPMASLPLTAAERVVGVLNVSERNGERPFTALELEYVSFISRMAASLIDDFRSRKELDESRDALVVALAKLAEYRDNDTGTHLDRVTAFSVVLAKELRRSNSWRAVIDDRFLEDLQRTVPLHDIGKVAVPDDILLKPAKLTPEEMGIMKRHAEIGAATIRRALQRAPATRFLKMAIDVAHAHHEWYDGTGYPRGLKGEDIPLAARITALADVYDAITTRRPYKKAMSHEKAMAIIRDSCGSQFDPAVVEAFLKREQQFRTIAAQFADEVPAPISSEAHEAPSSIARVSELAV